MKKKTVKKLRIGKETLLPLDSRPMREVVGGVEVDVAAPPKKTQWLHLAGEYASLGNHFDGDTV